MTHPYQLDPKKALEARRKAVSEQKVVTLREDSVRTPPSLGVDSFTSYLTGAVSQQPSNHDGEIPASLAKWVFRVLFWIFFCFGVATMLLKMAAP